MFKNLNKTTKIHSIRAAKLSKILGKLCGLNDSQLRNLSIPSLL